MNKFDGLRMVHNYMRVPMYSTNQNLNLDRMIYEIIDIERQKINGWCSSVKAGPVASNTGSSSDRAIQRKLILKFASRIKYGRPKFRSIILPYKMNKREQPVRG